jgi:Histone deacetylation protein Rxt3
VIVHSGHYRPVDAPDVSMLPDELDKPITEAAKGIDTNGTADVVVKTEPVEAPEVVNVKNPASVLAEPLVATPATPITGTNILQPDHDLSVTLRILPKLIKYAGSTRCGLESRGWGSSHDGVSLQVVKIQILERGSVGTKGRKVVSKLWGGLAKSVTKSAYEGGMAMGDSDDVLMSKPIVCQW